MSDHLYSGQSGQSGQPESARSESGLRSDVRWLLALTGAGVLTGILWRAVAPRVVAEGNVTERAIAGDGVLGLLGVLAGVVTALLVLARPGQVPARRLVAVVLGGCVAGAVSWGTGALLGVPRLRAVGMAFTWPLTTASVIFAVTGVRLLLRRR